MMKIILAFLLLFASGDAYSQQDTLLPPFKRFPAYPPVTLFLPDSLSTFSKADLAKNKPVMLVIFNPTCEHCRNGTKELTASIDKFRGVQIVMATWAPLTVLRHFIKEFDLAKYPSITVAQDTHYFLLDFFKPGNIPFHAFYNKKKELISVFEGNISVEKSLEELHK